MQDRATFFLNIKQSANYLKQLAVGNEPVVIHIVDSKRKAQLGQFVAFHAKLRHTLYEFCNKLFRTRVHNTNKSTHLWNRPPRSHRHQICRWHVALEGSAVAREETWTHQCSGHRNCLNLACGTASQDALFRQHRLKETDSNQYSEIEEKSAFLK